MSAAVAVALVLAVLTAVWLMLRTYVMPPRHPDPEVRRFILEEFCRSSRCRNRADVHSNIGTYCFEHLNAAIAGARAAGVPFLAAEVRDPDGEWVEL